MLEATENKCNIYTRQSSMLWATDLPWVALFFKLIYRADKPTVKEGAIK